MKVKLTARTTTLVVALMSTGLAYRGFTQEVTPQPAIAEFTALGTGSPKSTTCENSESTDPCVAVPVFIKAKDAAGETQAMTVDYVVGSDLVGKVRQDFGDTTTVLLRNLQGSLRSGVHDQNPTVQEACKDLLPAIDAGVPYKVNDGVVMPVRVEKKLAQVAENAQNLIGRKIVVTSGTRTPTKQAVAMRTKMSLGENLRGLYANKRAIGEVLWAAHVAKATHQSPVDAMANAIAGQVQNGVFISNHLREGAVDIRTRDLSHTERQAVLQAVNMVPGVRAMNEDTPPHFHLDID